MTGAQQACCLCGGVIEGRAVVVAQAFTLPMGASVSWGPVHPACNCAAWEALGVKQRQAEQEGGR
jgi:hypothetical protein